MRYFLLFPLLMLMACNSPGVDVWGGKSTKITVGNYNFKVIHTAERAQAYRTSAALRPKAREVFASAVHAIEQASGCSVDTSTLAGDVAMVTAELIC